MGAAVWSQSVPSPTLQRRINKAIALWKTGEFDVVLASGGVGKHPPSEAKVMEHMLSTAGIPGDAIVLEEQSSTTLENALFSIDILRSEGLTSVCVVTDGYHCARARMTFRCLGMPVTAISAASACPRPNFHVTVRAYSRELLALPFYVWKLWNLGRQNRSSQSP